MEMKTCRAGDPSPYCDNSNCENNQTCCTMADGSPGCCPAPNATCCGINNVCCPEGYQCDPIKKNCVRNRNETQSCSFCQFVVNAIQTKGCENVCKVIPDKYKSICDFIVSTGICTWISKHNNPFQVCSAIGLCGNPGSCKCGYCTPYVHDRCLSFPKKCPASAAFSADEHPLKELPGCLNGGCDANHYGCCLTCF